MKVFTDKKDICIEMHGREQLWAVRAKVRVPVDTIKDIRFEEKFQDWRKWQVRMPGTHAPRLLLAGSYWTELGWDFLYIKRPSRFINPMVFNVLVIETDQNRYARVIIDSTEKEAKKLIQWWKKQKKAKK